MIYNFEDYINELWTKGLTRKKNDEHRLEDGKYVMTEMGVKIHLHNPNIDYNDIIHNMLDDYDTSFSFDSVHTKENIPIDDSVFISFPDYEYFLDLPYLNEVNEGNVDEHDYKQICQGIIDALKNTLIIKNPDSRDRWTYNYLYCFVLINIYHFVDDAQQTTDDNSYIDNYIDDFKDCFETEFPNVKLSNVSDYNIVIDIDYNNLINYQEMKKFTEDYFNPKNFLDYLNENDELN